MIHETGIILISTQTDILNTELNDFKRSYGNDLHLKNYGNTVNINTDIDKLSRSYSLLIRF